VFHLWKQFFKTKKQFIQKGWALKNLQPLAKEYNRSKNSHYAGNPTPTNETIYL
jgi:hypothetical protein